MLSKALTTAAAGSAAGDYEISRSLRFNSADSAYLSRTPASAGNLTTWTWSGWVKRSALGSVQVIMSVASDANNFEYFRFESGDQLFYARYTAASPTQTFTTNAVYRDVGAWYHIIISRSGTTQRCYVNGVEQTRTSETTSSSNGLFNSTNAHSLGRRQETASQYFNGYLADINFVDGAALTPSSFGEVNEITGVWTPIRFAGSYGTNGFHLEFADNSDVTATTLGKDTSGNGNNWTPSGSPGFSVTAGAGNDSLVDSPTRYGTDTGAGGEVRGNYCTQNPLIRLNDNCILSNGNLGLEGSNDNYPGSKATFAFTSGKWYWETTITLKNNNPIIGICQNNYFSGGYDRIMYRSNGYYIDADGNEPTDPDAFTTGDIIGVSLDLDDANGKIRFYKNGVQQTVVAALDSVKSALSISTVGGVFPYTQLYTGDKVDLNFGQRPFAYTAPSGFKALVTTNLPEPTVLQGDDHFNTVTYTGTGSDPQSVTGVGFQPDWIWIKNRSAAYSHVLQDAVRGFGTFSKLATNSTNAEGTSGPNGDNYGHVSSVGADGFTLTHTINANNDGGTIRKSTHYLNDTYVAWNWKANGAGVSNTAGTISSTVSANTTAGISIVTWTGGAGTVGHGLGVAPKMVIAKNRTTAQDWYVWFTGFTSSQYLVLNGTNAVGTSASLWNGTLPSSTVIGLDLGGTNDIVAYCFAEVEGFSKFGSYTGNGSADGPFVYTGFRPAWVMIKNIQQAGGQWFIYDDVREPYNPNNSSLFAESSQAETANNSALDIDFLSNGWKIRNTGSGFNNSGIPYIFAAFAENPFKNSLAR